MEDKILRIPREVKIGGQNVTVCEVERINENALGVSRLNEGYIEIAKSFDKDGKQSESSKVNTFYHELTHCILQTMGEYELNDNERFVCTFAGFLADAMESARFIDNSFK